VIARKQNYIIVAKDKKYRKATCFFTAPPCILFLQIFLMLLLKNLLIQVLKEKKFPRGFKIDFQEKTWSSKRKTCTVGLPIYSIW
jgi:hypothetical protein